MRISSSFALGVGKSQIGIKTRETRAANSGLLLYGLAYEARAAPNRPHVRLPQGALAAQESAVRCEPCNAKQMSASGGLVRIADSEQPRSETLQILGIWIQFVSKMNSNEILRAQTLDPPV